MRKSILLIAVVALCSLSSCNAMFYAIFGCDTGFRNHSSYVVAVSAKCESSSQDYDQFSLKPGDSHTFRHPRNSNGNDDVTFTYSPTDTVTYTSEGSGEINITFTDR